MNRRKVQRRCPAKAEWHPWEEWHQRLFRLTGPDWTPPDRVQLRRTVKGGTYTAVFTDRDGVSCRLTVRLAVNLTTRAITVLDETMSMRLVTRVGSTGPTQSSEPEKIHDDDRP